MPRTGTTTTRDPARPRRGAPGAAWSKVPEVTVLFWVAKLLTTGMGETTWDWMEIVIGQYPALAISATAFVAALVAQFAVRRYQPAIYWSAVVMVSVFGTTVADLVHNDFGVPYWASTAVAAVGVAAVLALWYRVEGTLSIHSITTRRREVFYWATVLLTFALGTAAGDWTAGSLHLGYLPSGLIFLAAFALPALAWWKLDLNPILAFWLCYILTRPLGASFADYFGGPPQRGGLALGMDRTSLVLTVLIVIVVAVFAITGRDQQPAPAGTEPARTAR